MDSNELWWRNGRGSMTLHLGSLCFSATVSKESASTFRAKPTHFPNKETEVPKACLSQNRHPGYCIWLCGDDEFTQGRCTEALDEWSIGGRGQEKGNCWFPGCVGLARVMSNTREEGCCTRIKGIVFKYSPSHFVYLSLNSSPLNLSRYINVTTLTEDE